jgi:hypothetical protein
MPKRSERARYPRDPLVETFCALASPAEKAAFIRDLLAGFPPRQRRVMTARLRTVLAHPNKGRDWTYHIIRYGQA